MEEKYNMFNVVTGPVLALMYSTEWARDTKPEQNPVDVPVVELHQRMLSHFINKRAQLTGTGMRVTVQRKLLDRYIEQLAYMTEILAAAA